MHRNFNFQHQHQYAFKIGGWRSQVTKLQNVSCENFLLLIKIYFDRVFQANHKETSVTIITLKFLTLYSIANLRHGVS